MVGTPSTEEKGVSLFLGIHVEVIFDDRNQTINTTTLIGVSAGDKDAVETCYVIKHERLPLMLGPDIPLACGNPVR